jgi:hypothetical protein
MMYRVKFNVFGGHLACLLLENDDLKQLFPVTLVCLVLLDTPLLGIMLLS